MEPERCNGLVAFDQGQSPAPWHLETILQSGKGHHVVEIHENPASLALYPSPLSITFAANLLTTNSKCRME